MTKCRGFTAASFLALSLVATLPRTTAAADRAQLRVGASKVDITPSDLTGLTNMWRTPLEKVRDHVYVRALVLASGSGTAALVAAELLEFGDTRSLREQIERETGIPADSILIAPTHAHTTPRVGVLSTGASAVVGGAGTAAYTVRVYADIVEAVRRAKAGLQPARFGIGKGMSDVNVNRDEYTPKGYIWGNVLDGPSDKTVWVVKFEKLSGEPIAFFVNQGVHSVVMGPDTRELTGDLGGATSRFVEEYYGNGAVALWTVGAAGDQNSRYQNWDPNSGKLREPGFGLMETLGRMQGEEVVRVAGSITRVSDEAAVWTAQRTLTCPGQRADREAARRGEPAFTDVGPVDLRLSLLMLGNVAFAGVSAEVYTRIYDHLRKDSPFTNTILLSMVNDRLGYLIDDQSYGRTYRPALGVPVKQGCAEAGIVDGFVEMMNQY
jgi:neutral ceramidase